MLLTSLIYPIFLQSDSYVYTVQVSKRKANLVSDITLCQVIAGGGFPVISHVSFAVWPSKTMTSLVLFFVTYGLIPRIWRATARVCPSEVLILHSYVPMSDSIVLLRNKLVPATSLYVTLLSSSSRNGPSLKYHSLVKLVSPHYKKYMNTRLRDENGWCKNNICWGFSLL